MDLDVPLDLRSSPRSLPARWGGSTRVDPEAAQPLAGNQVVSFGIEPAAPPAETGARPPRAAPPAVALFAALLVLCVACEVAGRRCAARRPEVSYEHYYWTYDDWQRTALWAPAVALPYAALAAWCVWMRSSFQAGLSLHQSTRAYGAGAGVAAALFASRPWSRACLGDYGDGLASWFALTVLWALKGFSLVLVAHKLKDLHRPELARAVRRLSAAGLLCVALFAGLGALVAALRWRWLPLGARQLLGRWARFLLGIAGPLALLAALSYPLACLCGLWGLLATAARASSPRSPAQGRAACFVRLTALGLATSLATASVEIVGIFQPRWVLSNGWSALNALVECITVALFSGLVGPPSLRVLARDAFSAINCYTDDQLQAFYEKYLEYLDRAQVKWVRCGYLRRLAAAGAVMPRCQEVPGDQVVIGSSGFPLVRDGEKQRFVLSHPWLSKEHPDPTGVKLSLLVQQLDMLQASDAHAVFVDYMSLPQNDNTNPELQRLEAESAWPKPGAHPAVRTEAEEAQFKQALSAMEQIYSIGKTPVIVLPMDGDVDSGREYISRGWCLLEFCLSLSFANIANAGTHEPVRLLMEHVEAMGGHKVEGFREAFKMTHFTNSGDADVVLKLFENTLYLASGH